MKTLPFVLLLTFLAACGLKTSDRIDARQVNSDIKNRKPIRILERERQAEAAGVSPLVMEDVERVFAAASDPCTAIADSLLPTKWQVLKPKMEIICSSENNLEGKAKKVWDAYQAALESGHPINGNYQKMPNNEWLISIPRDIDGQLALLNITLGKEGLSKWVYLVKTKQVTPTAPK